MELAHSNMTESRICWLTRCMSAKL